MAFADARWPPPVSLIKIMTFFLLPYITLTRHVQAIVNIRAHRKENKRIKIALSTL
jgi:hypothetical protein